MVDFALSFPPGFLWGTASSAYQVEGSLTKNNWAAWEKTPGHVYQNQPAGRACEWWSGRYEEDFDRAVALNNNALRFSIEWSRVEPEPGRVEWGVIERYGAMIAALRARRLEPMITLHHFTLPQWVEEAGGWTNEDTVRHFADFVEVVIGELGHLATLWCTVNEPVNFATHSYLLGRWPPGKSNLRLAFRAIEHLLRGHIRAYHLIKEAQPEAQVGFTKHQIGFLTRRPTWLHFPARNTVRQLYNRAFIDALMTGTLRLPLHRVDIPEARDTLDWIGLDTYYRLVAGFNPLKPGQMFLQQRRPRAGLLGPESVGEIWPEGLLEHVKWLYRRTGLPIYITEAGAPGADDAVRRLFLVRSVRSLWKAVMHNLPVRGYFFWTLVDNFEWAEGWDPAFRFGLYGCDPQTQERTRRPSADLYAAICGANALTSDMVRAFVPDAMDELFPGVAVQPAIDWQPRA